MFYRRKIPVGRLEDGSFVYREVRFASKSAFLKWKRENRSFHNREKVQYHVEIKRKDGSIVRRKSNRKG